MSQGINREHAKECIGAGWHGIIDKIYDGLREETYVIQVKEKFGTLRFDVGAATEEEIAIMEDAEQESSITCEICGEPGKLREDLSWILTLCDEHYRETLDDVSEMRYNKKVDDEGY